MFGKKDSFIPDSEGFLKPIRHLAAQVFAGSEFRLRMNEKVSEVHFALENDEKVPGDLPKNGVYVKTAAGNEYWARYCIITFTVWRVLYLVNYFANLPLVDHSLTYLLTHLLTYCTLFLFGHEPDPESLSATSQLLAPFSLVISRSPLSFVFLSSGSLSSH